MIALIIAALATLQLHAIDRLDVRCSLEAVYHEARGEPYWARVGIAHVVRRRMELGDATACDVTHQPGQFSAWAGKNKPMGEDDSVREAAEISALVLAGKLRDPTRGAEFVNRCSGATKAWLASIDAVIVQRIGNTCFAKARTKYTAHPRRQRPAPPPTVVADAAPVPVVAPIPPPLPALRAPPTLFLLPQEVHVAWTSP